MDNGDTLYIYIGQKVADETIMSLFGYANSSEMRLSGVDTFYPAEGNPTSEMLSALIEQIKGEKSAGAYPSL
jgi:hypothetical protein